VIAVTTSVPASTWPTLYPAGTGWGAGSISVARGSVDVAVAAARTKNFRRVAEYPAEASTDRVVFFLVD
jgi:hypothetical protein